MIEYENQLIIPVNTVPVIIQPIKLAYSENSFISLIPILTKIYNILKLHKMGKHIRRILMARILPMKLQ